MGKACGTYGVNETCIQGFGEEIGGTEIVWKNRAQRGEKYSIELQEIGLGH